MEIHCAYTRLVSIEELENLFNPDNANIHPEEQIERLGEMLRYQGIRAPAVISKRSGKLVAGHGRIMAAKRNLLKYPEERWDQFPVQDQDFRDEDQERAHLHADNEIARWSETDYAKINSQIENYDPSFEVDMLGIKDFRIEPAEREPMHRALICPQCGFNSKEQK